MDMVSLRFMSRRRAFRWLFMNSFSTNLLWPPLPVPWRGVTPFYYPPRYLLPALLYTALPPPWRFASRLPPPSHATHRPGASVPTCARTRGRAWCRTAVPPDACACGVDGAALPVRTISGDATADTPPTMPQPVTTSTTGLLYSILVLLDADTAPFPPPSMPVILHLLFPTACATQTFPLRLRCADVVPVTPRLLGKSWYGCRTPTLRPAGHPTGAPTPPLRPRLPP